MRKEMAYALRRTVPVACGYIFLGMAFGVLLNEAGYGPVWALCSSLFVYAGSMQFIMVSLLAAGAPIYTVAVTTFLVNARHIFYGIGFVEKFRKIGGWRYPFMALTVTDETYCVLCSMDAPTGMDWGDCAFYVSIFDQCYWVLGSLLGSLLGQALPVDLTGIDFSMTALFLVIFLEQWRGAKSHLPALLGLGCGAAFLLALGPDNFLLPALCTTVAVLLLARPVLNREKEAA